MNKEYLPLHKLLNIYDHEYYEREFEKRINSFTTIKFPFYINDSRTRLFMVLNLKTIAKLENIQKQLGKIKLISSKNAEPRNPFYKHYTQTLFIDELVATNEIEGVFTSRKDMNKVYESLQNSSSFKTIKKSNKIRHKFLVTKYNQLQNNEIIPLNSAEDIRSIYDELLAEEIEDDCIPDGEIFRKDSVTVYSRKNPGKIVHTGLIPEKAIIAHVNQLLDYLNDGDNVNIFIKIAIVHYYFGYIHPFYDGNGRINRFISSSLISEFGHNLLALKLSKKIKDEIKNYDEAFIITNDEINKGEATFFVDMFIDVLEKAAIEIVEELSYFEKKIRKFTDIIKDPKYQLNEDEFGTLFVVYQAYLTKQKLKKSELNRAIDRSDSTTTNILEKLSEKKWLVYIKKSKIELSEETLLLING